MRNEVKYHGRAACLALFQSRPQDMIKAYVDRTRVNDFTPLLKRLARDRKAYHLVEASDLEKLTESLHHRGICLVGYEKPEVPFESLVKEAALAGRSGGRTFLYLDGVENPHNMGSIVRAAAHFGVTHILGDSQGMPRLSGAVCRVAQGGAEAVSLVRLKHPVRQIKQLKELGYSFVATAVRDATSVYEQKLPPKMILAMGSEREGMGDELMRLADRKVIIPGAGGVESLNVSVACGVLLGEHFRLYSTPSRS